MKKRVFILDHRSQWSHFAFGALSAHGYDPIEFGCQQEVLALVHDVLQDGERLSIIVDSLSDRTEAHDVKPLEVAKVIAEQLPSATVIVASSRPTPDEAVLAYEVGASAYLPKTCDESHLVALVRKVVDRFDRSMPAKDDL
jgi:DNA-binding NarL/FixJ family response regulator